jgi:hypothetical protein
MPTYGGLPYFTLQDPPDGASQQQALAQAADQRMTADEAARIAAYVYAVNTSGQAIPDQNSTVVQWTTVDPSGDNAHNTGTWNAGVRTIAYDGVYVVRVRLTFPAVNTVIGIRQVSLYVNGDPADYDQKAPSTTSSTRLEAAYVGPIKAGQTVQVFTYQSQSTTQRLTSDPGACSFMLARVSSL